MIALTMGDPAGVGPELCLRVAARDDVQQACIPLIFGDSGVLAGVAQRLALPMPDRILEWGETPAWLTTTCTSVVNISDVQGKFAVGEVSETCGAASFAYVNAAIDAALAGHVAAVSTGPINKAAWHRAGITFPGHTELFAHRSNRSRFCMLQYSEAISCAFVTMHVPYGEVPSRIRAERIEEVIQLGGQAIRQLSGRDPRMVICGLNPHAGENGLFGDIEQRVIGPASERARQAGWNLVGPLPADTAFVQDQRQRTDLFICMYHDQGLIPLKALAFDTAVNVTLGLPIIRTSVDHGTAFDIAYQGLARDDSFANAVLLAARLAAESSVSRDGGVEEACEGESI